MEGLIDMKLNTKVKSLIGIVVVLILGGAGIIIWNYQSMQETPISSISQLDQQNNIMPLAKDASAEKIIVSKNPNKLTDNQGKDEKDVKNIVQTASLEEKAVQKVEESEPKAETKKDEDSKLGLTPEQEQGRIDFVAAGAKELPVLVEQWKDVMAKRDTLDSIYGIQYSEEKGKEVDRLADERMRIEHRFQYLAMSYHSLYPEEGAIFYPEGWIGQLGKQIGLVFTRTNSPPSGSD